VTDTPRARPVATPQRPWGLTRATLYVTGICANPDCDETILHLATWSPARGGVVLVPGEWIHAQSGRAVCGRVD
jgi:hypothetical protein